MSQALQNVNDLQQKRRTTWAGVAVNLPLAVGKIACGWLSGSQALVADGIHSASDLLSDAAVLWALGHSHRPADADHPFGHGRFETMATLVVAALLGLAAFGILVEAVQRLFDPPGQIPGILALWVAVASILLKETLFQYTRAVGRRTGSAMITANAWHHRSDAATSIVALAGIGGAMAGWPVADTIAAAVVAVMLGRIAWTLGRPALAELVDTSADPADLARIEAEIRKVPGLRDVHDLRLRRAGKSLRGDAHVTFDGHLTLSEAHRLTEAACANARAAVPELSELVLHAEPEGHADGPGAHSAPLRPEIETILKCALAEWGDASVLSLQLDYRDDGLCLHLVLDGAGADPATLHTHLEDRIARALGAPPCIEIATRHG